MRRIRTPYQPDPVRTVTEAEYTDLSRLGAVLEDLDGPLLTGPSPATNTSSAPEPLAADPASPDTAPRRKKTATATGESGADTKEG